ncbi:50S ribosomal protein L17 [Cryphonectria parasitica EP155]|uniref:Large ribosomal subunit protein bL17m n=1 Tax=Cryphonectria parasitica (strain ATCC 38755 / EP155) TaxID=660469 RepID=A0A9P4XUH1_CRYP1|nr:50S ribosomal protein L17 [Cryphonectria parasitica EP155]KAF3761146.1 50S ribosomal protein L17 [Cryphonectria parasitica EP155]
MAGGHMKYRTLGRDSAHRQALLRNLVTSLVKQESIQTTWPKAKEAQRLADNLITLAKNNNETARRKAQAILYTPDLLLPKLFGELRERYENRPGGYTRVLRTEPMNKHQQDQAPSALLLFVDGPADVRFAMTAATVARDEVLGKKRSNNLTMMNVKKMLAFRKGGEKEFRDLVEKIKRQERNNFIKQEEEQTGRPYKFQV